MGEFITNTATLQKITEQLEDNSLQNHVTKNSKYTALQLHLAKVGYVDCDLFQRVLNMCVRDLEEDIKYTAVALKIVITILNKRDEAYPPDPAILVPSAVCIIRKINITSTISNVENLRDLYMKTIALYPDETLVSIVTSNEAIIVELFKSHNYAQLQMEYKILLYDFLYKLLTILPTKIKSSFMNSMTSVLFSKVIPSILDDISCVTVENDILKSLDVLEYITKELVEIDYFKIPQWMSFLESICNSKKYPQIMKNLLEKNSQVWHRLWIVFIKLLKNQITSNVISSGTPINSMLPIVETAFKLDTRNRCRAFECWTILMNIFSYEIDENCINKRLKLLIIPLKLNNAKVEETAVAKFNSWWNLINKFHFKLEKFVEPILISFLHFCFGKHNSTGKSMFIPGQASKYLKTQSVEALVEIIGHVKCSGCVKIIRLEDKIINKKILENYWMDWTYSLKVAIQFLLGNINESVPQHVLCLLRSFILTVSCLPSNNIKDDIINELILMLSKFVQDNEQQNYHYADTVFALLLSFFIDEVNTKEILSIKGEKQSTLYKIITLTMNPCFKKYYETQNKQEMVQKLKPLAKYILQDSVGLQFIIDNILNSLPANDVSLTFWTALVDCIGQSDNDLNLQNVFNILIWPLESLNMFNEVKYPAKLWYTTYSIMHSKFRKSDFGREVSQILHSSNIVTNSSIYFGLYVTLAILKCGLMTENSSKYETDVQLLQVLSKRIDCYEDIEELFPILVDTLILVLQCYAMPNNGDLAETIISCVKNVLKLMMSVFKGSSDIVKISTIMENLLKAVDVALKSETYSKLFYMLSEISTFYSSIYKNLALSIFTKSSCNNQQGIICNKDKTNKQLKVCIGPKTPTKKTIENCKFSTPNKKKVQSIRKKKNVSIDNTLVENGEEFVVVKSNWKFNPKKLTDSQKEKLKRKRDDIPALYQDLSQSQDDSNLKAWKTDSQDLSTSGKSYSTATNEGKNASSILKNLSSADVVPTILENILSEKEKTESKAAHTELSNFTNKDCKTPRMALQDRVFRNVRNLIEKSKKESISGSSDEKYNQIENIVGTPSTKKTIIDITSLSKSAPASSLLERPSRVKRKPKKFEDTLISELTKRHLQKGSLSENEIATESFSINTIKHGTKYDNLGVKEKSSLLSETGVDVIKENKGIINEHVTVVIDKSIVKPTSIIENTKSLRVKLIKNDIDNVIDKSKCTMIKTNSDLVCKQNNTPQKQKPKDECQSIPSISDNNCSGQRSPTHDNHNVHKSPLQNIIKKRKSRIENELAIDMAIDFLHLNTPLISHKRSTRNNLASPNTPKKTRLTDKLSQSPPENLLEPKRSKKAKSVNNDSASVTDIEVQDKSSIINNLPPDDFCSEDIIESSQDSTLTTNTVIKKTPKKIPFVCIENIPTESKLNQNITETQNLLLEDQCQEIVTNSSAIADIESCNIVLQKEAYVVLTKEKAFSKTKTPLINTESELNILLSDTDCQNIKPDSSLINQQSKDDSELPHNKTVDQNKSEIDLTENMNTEEICINDLSDDVIIIDNEKLTPVSVSSEDNLLGVGTQEIADAATQPINHTELCLKFDIYNNSTTSEPFNNNSTKNGSKTESVINSQLDNTKTIIDPENITTDSDKINDISSPFKGDVERKQDFMKNTLEISPIKALSPNKYNEKFQSPNKMNDCVVILLPSPVHSNGEPIKKESPEIFTDDKTSFDKIEYSPTRSEINGCNTSPTSSLSLKKSRPQGRAAQMLGLCAPEKLQSFVCSEKSDIEEVKKNIQLNTPARRNLRMLYNSTNDNNANTIDNEDSGNFLKLNRLLPATDCSPSGPILKRKFVEIIDDIIISPASKRKRVSFHDPPVSTTVSIQKYIEPSGIRSPQNSAQKRYERQLRSKNSMKSPRRLDNVFKLNSVLTNAVESFSEGDLPASNDDTQMTSLEETPTAEIVKASELNDTEPICLELVNCKDPIENIAAELSSTAMKSLLIKELEGKIETIGDLAKMTEVDVNRLCIKAPKVKVAKQAMKDYYIQLNTNLDKMPTVTDIDLVESDCNKVQNNETQTEKMMSTDAEIQTTAVSSIATSMQTDVASSSTTSVQTEESEYKCTSDIIKACILERHDYLEQLTKLLGESEIQMIVEKLSFSAIIDMCMKKIDVSNASVALSRLLDHKSIQRSTDKGSPEINQLSYIREYLQERFNSKDLSLFCLNWLMDLHHKSS